MVMDTSALVAIVLSEPAQAWLREPLIWGRLGSCRPTSTRGRAICSFVSFDAAQSRAAIAAFGRFGKGTGHRAELNFGDCAVYALAALRGEPVLATSGDFKATDLMTVHIRQARE